MEYYEGIIKNTEFFTTSELAEKLKMNVQVITRKVQAGEISAFKIGKDWRIPEQSVYDWLQQRSNLNGSRKKASPRRNVKLVKSTSGTPEAVSPSRRTKRTYVLEYILAQFEPNRLYQEAEVKRIVGRYNDDYQSVRDEFLAEGMMEQVDGGYRRRRSYSLSGA